MELRTEIQIDAPLAAVWDVLTDFPRYSEWNPFIQSVGGELREGTRLAITLTPPDGSTWNIKPRVLRVRPEAELRWRGRLFIPKLFDGEHFFLLEQLGEKRVRFVHGEDFSGILVQLLRSTLTQTARGFVGMNQALRRRAEALAP
jgi:hypothetical protein